MDHVEREGRHRHSVSVYFARRGLNDCASRQRQIVRIVVLTLNIVAVECAWLERARARVEFFSKASPSGNRTCDQWPTSRFRLAAAAAAVGAGAPARAVRVTNRGWRAISVLVSPHLGLLGWGSLGLDSNDRWGADGEARTSVARAAEPVGPAVSTDCIVASQQGCFHPVPRPDSVEVNLGRKKKKKKKKKKKREEARGKSGPPEPRSVPELAQTAEMNGIHASLQSSCDFPFVGRRPGCMQLATQFCRLCPQDSIQYV